VFDDVTTRSEVPLDAMAIELQHPTEPVAMSWDEYTRIDARGEYIDGWFHPMNPPVRRHQVIVHGITDLLLDTLGEHFFVVEGWGWKPSSSEFVPDVLVTPATDEDVRFTGTPVLAVEVLSTNRSHDTALKFRRYAAESLPNYWIVDPEGPVVDVFSLDGGSYRLDARVGPDEETTVVLAGFEILLRPGGWVR
jgi:Uma2 family endonuclease